MKFVTFTLRYEIRRRAVERKSEAERKREIGQELAGGRHHTPRARRAPAAVAGAVVHAQSLALPRHLFTFFTQHFIWAAQSSGA